jgi:hypothetical protein
LKDTKKILRLALFNALNGNVLFNAATVSVYEEKLPSGVAPDMFILLLNQQETPQDFNSEVFITRSSIDIEVIHKTGSDVSKDDIDNVYNDIMEIVFPARKTLGLTIPVGFQFQEGYIESCFTNTIVLSETESVITEKVKLVFIITQQ